MDDESKRLTDFCNSDHDCACFDGTFEEFNECCGKKHGIQNPVGILFNMVESMAKKSKVKRLRDMSPQEATKTLKNYFEKTGG